MVFRCVGVFYDEKNNYRCYDDNGHLVCGLVVVVVVVVYVVVVCVCGGGWGVGVGWQLILTLSQNFQF